MATDWHPSEWRKLAVGSQSLTEVGEHLHSPDGRTVKVAGVRHFVQTDAVCDLTIDSVYDFYVSTTGSY